MAAAQARMIAAEQGLRVDVASAGISAVDGEQASGHAQSVAKSAGSDLSAHRSTRLDTGLVASADLILTMTVAHRRSIVEQWPAEADRVMTLGEAAGLDLDVEDPWGGPVEAYERTQQQLGKLIRAAWPVIAGRTGS